MASNCPAPLTGGDRRGRVFGRKILEQMSVSSREGVCCDSGAAVLVCGQAWFLVRTSELVKFPAGGTSRDQLIKAGGGGLRSAYWRAFLSHYRPPHDFDLQICN